MLYLVPQGADDDWYWIYATVTDGREKTAYVVRTVCTHFVCVVCVFYVLNCVLTFLCDGL